MDKTKQQIGEEWLERHKISGLSGRKWCEEQGVSECQFWYWKKRLKRDSNKENNASTWLPVIMEDPIQQASALTVRIGTLKIEVRSGYDPQLLQDVVRTLMVIC